MVLLNCSVTCFTPYAMFFPTFRRYKISLAVSLAPVTVLFFCTLLFQVQLASARTITWTQLISGGSLQSATNWDSNSIPGIEDDVIIHINRVRASTSRGASNSVAGVSNPWDVNSPSTSSPSSTSTLFTLTMPWSIKSLTARGDLVLLFDTQVKISHSLTLSDGARLELRGGQLSAAQIEVDKDAEFVMDLAQLGASSSSSSGSNPTSSFIVKSSGTVSFDSPSGSSHLQSIALQVQSGSNVFWRSGPLILDSSSIHIDSGGVFDAFGDILTEGSPNNPSLITNEGTLMFASSQTQSASIQIRNKGSMMVATSSSSSPQSFTDSFASESSSVDNNALRMLNLFKQEGILRIQQGRSMALAYESADFTSSSRTILEAGAVMVAQSGEIAMAGRIENPPISNTTAAASSNKEIGGELLISSRVMQSGVIDVFRLRLKGGSLSLSPDSHTIFAQVEWITGAIVGGGSLNIGHAKTNEHNGVTLFNEGDLRIGGTGGGETGSKVLAGPSLHVFGQASILSSHTMLLQSSSILHIGSGSVFNHDSLSTIAAGDDSNVALQLDGDSAWNFVTAASASSAARMTTTVSVPVRSDSVLTVSGKGEVLFKREGVFQSMHIRDSAGVKVQGRGANSTFVINEPVDASGEGQYLFLQSCSAELASTSAISNISALAIFDASLLVRQGGLSVSSMSIGSNTAQGVLTGPGVVEVKNIRFNSGEINLDQMRVLDELSIGGIGSKLLGLRNLTLVSGSSSSISNSEVRVGDDLHWLIETNANFTIGSGANLIANRPSSPITGQPCLHNLGSIIWSGRKSEHSVSSLEIMNHYRISIVEVDGDPIPSSSANQSESVNPSYQALLSGGLKSSPHSVLSISPHATFVSACPTNISEPVYGCTLGLVEGQGTLQLEYGMHSFWSRVNLTSTSGDGTLRINDGRHEFYQQVVADSFLMNQGEMILHSYAFMRHIQINGGFLVGFPILNSALVLLSSTNTAKSTSVALFSHPANYTLSLSGLAFICGATCQFNGGDFVLHNGAQIVTTPRGRLSFDRSGTVVASGIGGGAFINSGNTCFKHTAPTKPSDESLHPFLIRVPILNRGIFTVAESNSLEFAAPFQQDSPQAMVVLENEGQIASNNMLQLQAGTLYTKSNSIIRAPLELGGRLQRDVPSVISSGPLHLLNDMVMSPSASIVVPCQHSELVPTTCKFLQSNGTIYLNGFMNVTYNTALSSSNRNQSVELFEGRQIIGSFQHSTFDLKYTPTTVSVTDTPSSTQLLPSQYASIYDAAASWNSVADISTSTQQPVQFMIPHFDPTPLTEDQQDESAFTVVATDESDPHAHHHHNMPEVNDSHESTADSHAQVPNSLPFTAEPHSNENISRTAPQELNAPWAEMRLWGLSSSATEALILFFIIFSSLLLILCAAVAVKWYRMCRREDTQQHQLSSSPQPTVVAQQIDHRHATETTAMLADRRTQQREGAPLQPMSDAAAKGPSASQLVYQPVAGLSAIGAPLFHRSPSIMHSLNAVESHSSPAPGAAVETGPSTSPPEPAVIIRKGRENIT